MISALQAGNWCNPPGSGTGILPTANTSSVSPLLDAYLWVKTPGQSDGQCDAAGEAEEAGAHEIPEGYGDEEVDRPFVGADPGTVGGAAGRRMFSHASNPISTRGRLPVR